MVGPRRVGRREGLASIAPELASEVGGGTTYWQSKALRPVKEGERSPYLLPAFDEYLVAYKDRDAVLDPRFVRRLNAGGGLLAPCVVVDGYVVGAWRRTPPAIEVRLFTQRLPSGRAIGKSEIESTARRYEAFLGSSRSHRDIVVVTSGSVAVRARPQKASRA